MAEIVKVVREGGKGYHSINKQDFDPVRHVLWEPDAIRPEPKAAKKAAPEPAQPTQDK